VSGPFGRHSSRVARRNHCTESHPLLKADGPELIADHAVRFDRVATIEESAQILDAKTLLKLFAVAVRTRRGKDNCPAHVARNLGGIAAQQLSGRGW
jgi:hypothetical protein